MDDLSSCSLYIVQKAQKHPFLDDNCIMYNNHPIMDDYRWFIIIHFWNRTIPGYPLYFRVRLRSRSTASYHRSLLCTVSTLMPPRRLRRRQFNGTAADPELAANSHSKKTRRLPNFATRQHQHSRIDHHPCTNAYGQCSGTNNCSSYRPELLRQQKAKKRLKKVDSRSRYI